MWIVVHYKYCSKWASNSIYIQIHKQNKLNNIYLKIFVEEGWINVNSLNIPSQACGLFSGIVFSSNELLHVWSSHIAYLALRISLKILHKIFVGIRWFNFSNRPAVRMHVNAVFYRIKLVFRAFAQPAFNVTLFEMLGILTGLYDWVVKLPVMECVCGIPPSQRRRISLVSCLMLLDERSFGY